MSKNLLARIAVAVVFIPIILWICYRGGWWLFGMVSVFAIIGMSEFLIGEKHRPSGIVFWVTLVGLGVMLTASYIYFQYILDFGVKQPLGLQLALVAPVSVVFLFFVIGSMLYALGKTTPAELFTKHTRLMWGLLYAGMLYPFVFLLAELLNNQNDVPVSGGDALLFLFGLLWVGDTAAMGIGAWIGKHKLAPTVSPNKTVEGFIGGIAGALAIGVLMIFWKFSGVAWYHVLIIALGCSVFGQLGDLVESMWKRSIGIKDSSAIIPGHGGVLDRFDSLLFAAPFMSFYIAIVLMA
jgi:phosphatidate cytidylyltransferase